MGVAGVHAAQETEKPAVRPGEGAWVPSGHPPKGLDRRQNHSH